MDYRWVTVKPLISNSPASGQVETIPVGNQLLSGRDFSVFQERLAQGYNPSTDWCRNTTVAFILERLAYSGLG